MRERNLRVTFSLLILHTERRQDSLSLSHTKYLLLDESLRVVKGEKTRLLSEGFHYTLVLIKIEVFSSFSLVIHLKTIF